ncbi:septal ring lytic transglycosylase RlpA family protein [Acidocella sp.]|uniref:septal ring lytic transglycosylase RlpA family protein n=1 Tax=Acidocella sp. TaxID=50710 RepID=UPI00260E2550|nr:septal ring lytic transglycosylase RlpA family protein [Acidocella sp.]
MELTTLGRTAVSRLRLAPAMALPLLSGLLSACTTQPIPAPQASLAPLRTMTAKSPPCTPMLVADGPEITGIASWYRPGPGLHRTCTGAHFTGWGMTAASHSIRLGTHVRVALLSNASRSVVVKIDDCMPRNGRLLDLSEGAAKELGIIDMGVARVSVTPVEMVDRR